MSQLSGGRKRHNTEMEAAWGHLGQNSSQLLREENRRDSPALSAYQREISDPAANFSSTPQGPSCLLGTWSITTVAMDPGIYL